MAGTARACHVLFVANDPSNDRWDAAQEGAELLREGENDHAVEELERVAAVDPNNEYAFFFLGSAHFEKGRFDIGNKIDYLRATVELALERPDLADDFRAILYEIVDRERQNNAK